MGNIRKMVREHTEDVNDYDYNEIEEDGFNPAKDTRDVKIGCLGDLCDTLWSGFFTREVKSKVLSVLSRLRVVD
jgi:hypothetical protein